MQYSPYGSIIEQSGALPTDRLFTGQRHEASIELYDYRARFYDPLTSNFLSPDTMVPGVDNPLAWNRYGYVMGNPVRYSDPSGHCPGCAFGVRGGDIDARMLILGFGGYAATVTAVKLADEVGVSIPSFPARGPNIPPLPGYGEGELPLRDPMHIPGVTLGEGIEHLRGPFITVLDDEPRTLALEFPLLQPGAFEDNILLYKGGRYKDLPGGPGIERHHIPADSVSPLSRYEGPAIEMDVEDHRQTASWGRSANAIIYRAIQKRLIKQGRFMDAVQMDIRVVAK